MKYNKLLPSLLSLFLTSCCGSRIGLTKLFLYKITNIYSNNNVSMYLYIGLKQKGDGTLSFSKLKNPKLTIYINYIKSEMRPSDITNDETKIKEKSIILFERDNFEDNDYFFVYENRDNLSFDSKEQVVLESSCFPQNYTRLLLIMNADEDSTNLVEGFKLEHIINYTYVDQKLIIEKGDGVYENF